MSDLEEGSREILRLRYRDGMTRDQVSARVGLSLGGVKASLLRAKAKLRRCVERRLER